MLKTDLGPELDRTLRNYRTATSLIFSAARLRSVGAERTAQQVDDLLEVVYDPFGVLDFAAFSVRIVRAFALDVATLAIQRVRG